MIPRRSRMHSWATRPVRPGVEHRVVLRQPGGDVVGRRHRRERGPPQARRPPSAAGRPTGSAARRGCRTGPPTRGPTTPAPGQERGQVLGHRDRARRPGPPPPCGMQKVLCRLRWLTSPPNAPGRATPTSALRLAPSTYTCPPAACTASQTSRDARLVHAVRGRVGDHQRGQRVAVLVDLGAQVVEVDVAGRAGGHDHHPHPGHHRRRRVGAVRPRRDEADVAVVVAAAAVVGGDRQQARELALAARVGLQRHRRVPGELGQPALQVGDQLERARGVARRARTGAGRRTRAR